LISCASGKMRQNDMLREVGGAPLLRSWIDQGNAGSQHAEGIG
jgi:hypothetical protein